MSKQFRYTTFGKFCFYLSYFWYKLIIPLEMRKNHIGFWLYEIRYTLAKFKQYDSSVPYTGSQDIISTRFGDYKVRRGTSDAANVSPAFERADINALLKLLTRLLSAGNKVLFCDIGGDIGSYSVLIANRFATDRLSIACFEPVPESLEYIEQNLKLNDVHGRVMVFPFALFNTDGQETVIKLVVGAPGSSTMTADISSEVREVREVYAMTKRLDTIFLNDVTDYDAVVLKIDVEGVEQQVLEGASALINLGKIVHLVVEDFIKPSIIKFLEETGWDFVGKVTNYNSWWVKK